MFYHTLYQHARSHAYKQLQMECRESYSYHHSYMHLLCRCVITFTKKNFFLAMCVWIYIYLNVLILRLGVSLNRSSHYQRVFYVLSLVTFKDREKNVACLCECERKRESILRGTIFFRNSEWPCFSYYPSNLVTIQTGKNCRKKQNLCKLW